MDNIFFSNGIISIVFISFCAFCIVIKVLPVVIYLAVSKNLIDEPVKRSSHIKKISNLGGVGVFISFLLCACMSGAVLGLNEFELKQLLALIGAISVLFFIGVKDDLIGISPLKKIGGQLIATCIVVFAANLRVESFYGLFGIGELNLVFSIFASVFLLLFFTNAFNLIDGIDGLAGLQGVMVSFVLGVYFVVYDQLFAGLISFVLIACLLGFLGFNFSEKNKIFMGDSGSLFIGFLLVLQALYFLKIDFNLVVNPLPHKIVLLFVVFAFPLLDTLRVFFLRLFRGESPFKADRNHLHHKLLDLGLTHVNATVVIIVSNIALILLAFLTGSLEGNVQLALLASIALSLFCIPFLIKTNVKESGHKAITQS